MNLCFIHSVSVKVCAVLSDPCHSENKCFGKAFCQCHPSWSDRSVSEPGAAFQQLKSSTCPIEVGHIYPMDDGKGYEDVGTAG